MEDRLQPFRQPLVTATGIILGFILNFASSFVKTESALQTNLAYLVGACIMIGITCLIIVLFKALQMKYKEEQQIHYNKILRLFIMGISISFFGVIVDMFANFMID